MLNSYKDEKNIPTNKNHSRLHKIKCRIAQNHIAQKYCKTFIKLRFSGIHTEIPHFNPIKIFDRKNHQNKHNILIVSRYTCFIASKCPKLQKILINKNIRECVSKYICLQQRKTKTSRHTISLFHKHSTAM